MDAETHITRLSRKDGTLNSYKSSGKSTHLYRLETLQEIDKTTGFLKMIQSHPCTSTLELVPMMRFVNTEQASYILGRWNVNASLSINTALSECDDESDIGWAGLMLFSNDPYATGSSTLYGPMGIFHPQ